MNASVLAWNAIERLRQAGARRAAIFFANLIGGDRRFCIDRDGDWINRQENAGFASPEVHARRLAFVEAETADIFFWNGIPDSDDIVFDIGAGIGEETVVMASRARHVFAVEAHPGTYRCLAKTISLSGLRNVTPIHCAIGDRDGETMISTDEHHLANTIGKGGGEAVPMRSIASLCAEHGIGAIGFLKMNIEGAERLAIQGFGSVPIDQAVISCYDFIAHRGDFFRTRDLVQRHLEASGYVTRRRMDHPQAFIRDTIYARKCDIVR